MNKKLITMFLVTSFLTGCGQMDTYNGAGAGTNEKSSMIVSTKKEDKSEIESSIVSTTEISVSENNSATENVTEKTTTTIPEINSIEEKSTKMEDKKENNNTTLPAEINEPITITTDAPIETIPATDVTVSDDKTVQSYVSNSPVIDWYYDSDSDLTEKWFEIDSSGYKTVISDTSELKSYLLPLYRDKIIQYYLDIYTDDFFENNILLVNSILQPCGTGAMISVDYVNATNGNIEVNTKWNYESDGCYTEMISLCFVQIAIPKQSYAKSSVMWSIS